MKGGIAGSMVEWMKGGKEGRKDGMIQCAFYCT